MTHLTDQQVREIRDNVLSTPNEIELAADLQETRAECERLRAELNAGFCSEHVPNESRRYSGCVICSRNEESTLIEEVLKSFGWAHAEEAEMYLGGSQWYCIGEEERGTWGTADALNKALEDYDSLREAHKKARLYAAKEKARAESAEAECERLRGLLREILKRYDLRGPASCTAVVLRNAIEAIRTALSTGDAKETHE